MPNLNIPDRVAMLIASLAEEARKERDTDVLGDQVEER